MDYINIIAAAIAVICAIGTIIVSIWRIKTARDHATPVLPPRKDDATESQPDADHHQPQCNETEAHYRDPEPPR